VLLLDATGTAATLGNADVDGLHAEPGAGRDHRRLAGVDSGDDLGAVDPLQIDRGDPAIGMTHLALDELKRHFRDKTWALHVPRDLQKRALAVGREAEALSKQLGRSPKPREVARVLGCSVEEVLEAQQAAASYEATSLNVPTTRDDDEAPSLVDLLGGEDSAYELVEDREAIASTWQTLPEVERLALELRFVHDLNQRKIGERIGYSQMHVSRLFRRALTRLEPDAAAA
jgi:RNA polymerase sigma-B factor